MICRFLRSVNHPVTLGVTHAFFSRMGHDIRGRDAFHDDRCLGYSFPVLFSCYGIPAFVSRLYTVTGCVILKVEIERETGSRIARPIILLYWYLDVSSKEANS